MKFVRLTTHIWSYGLYDSIETALKVAEMVMEENKYKRMFIKDSDTDEVIKTIESLE